MRFKAKVLARFPDARTVVMRRWKWGEMDPRYVAVFTGEAVGSIEDGWDYSGLVRLDIHDPDDGNNQQLAAAAWRSAYYWCMRNPVARELEAA